MIESLKNKITRLGKDKKLVAVLFILAIGVLLLIASASDGNNEKGSRDVTLDEYGKRLEASLENFCSSVEGVGKCRVMVTFEEGAIYEYKSGNLISSTPPRVKGITVLCRGGDSMAVKAELSEMLAGLFEIGKNRICVLKLSS